MSKRDSRILPLPALQESLMLLAINYLCAPKFSGLSDKIRVAAVSYLNTKPLLYGIERGDIGQDIDMVVDYPAQLATMLKQGEIDLALLPVAAIPAIPGAHVVSDYGIAADGNVVSVAIFSRVPISEVRSLYLDYQSRTSVRLAQLLMECYWKQQVTYLPASENYIEDIKEATAGVIIGDRALQQLGEFEYVYDLSAAWKVFTGLHFVFAAWVANRELPEDFKTRFNAANAMGLAHINEIVAANTVPYYNLNTYYTENIKYFLDENKKQGLARFLEMIK